jgi:predicted transcriptional regulator
MRQNLTVSLDKQLVQKLRVIAAERSTSISGMLSDELRRIVERSEQYNNAKRRALEALATGLHLGGRPATRDELHDRQALR